MKANGIVAHANTAIVALTVAFCAGLSIPAVAAAPQDPQLPAPSAPAAPASAPVGVDIFGGASVSWPAATDSFEALDLDVPSLEYGGGVRVTNLWRYLFAQVTVNRWSDTGERAFVDSEGNVFPLGVELDVEATYVDAAVGWKAPMFKDDGSIAAWAYVGGGAGVTMYSEKSPFAEPGEDIDESKVSYNVVAGAEVPIARRFAVFVEGRYRYVPGLLGEAGVSEALGEETFGGFGIGAGVRIGFGGGAVPGGRQTSGDAPAPPPPQPALGTIPVQPATVGSAGVVLNEAPVFLLPDRTRTPLRMLAPGTSVRVVEENKEWYRVQFADPQFGPRMGWIERKFVQLGKS